MSIGTGLFFGLVFCGIVFLYTQTKNSWNWGKAKKYIIYTLASPIIIGLVVWGGVISYEAYKNRTVIVNSIDGFVLGENYVDVLFKHGKPDSNKEFEEFAARWLLENINIKGTQRYKDFEEIYNDWRPRKEGEIDGSYNYKQIILSVKNSKILHIVYNCKNDGLDWKEVNGISCGGSGESIAEKFGDDVRVLCSSDKDDLSRVFDVAKYGTRYYLTTNSVYRFMVASQEHLKSYTGKNWIPCS